MKKHRLQPLPAISNVRFGNIDYHDTGVVVIIITEPNVGNVWLLKTAGKPWKESASRPPNLKTPLGEGGGLIFQCFNSERSLLSSRPWLPKINYSDPNIRNMRISVQ